MNGIWCVTCKKPIFGEEQAMRVGSSQYQHVRCPMKLTAVNPKKEMHMATPVKPAAKPVKPAAKPATAPAKAAAPAKPAAPVKAAAPAKPDPTPTPTPAPTPAEPAVEKAPRKRREGPAYADIDLSQYGGNTITFGPKARDEQGNIINPKRGKSAERFTLYQDGETVAAALERGIKVADLRWDLAHDFIVLQ